MSDKMPDDWEPTSMGGGDPLKLKIIMALLLPFAWIAQGVLWLITKIKKT